MKFKIKSIIIALSILIILGILFLIISPYIIGISSHNLLKMDGTNISKVFMRSGKTGNSVSTTDKIKIKGIFHLIDNRQYTKSLDQEPRAGYTYFYDFYAGNKKVLRITGSGSCVGINGTRYNSDKEISTAGLDKWFNSFPITKWPNSAR